MAQKLELVGFIKLRQGKKGKPYYSFAHVKGEKFTWMEDIVGFATKDGSIALKKRVEDLTPGVDEGLPS